MAQGPGAKSGSELPALVPLFPLPNVVLFPGAVLPLHVFEERYKQMTGDVLGSHRQVAMALLRAGWEKDYYGRPAIEPVVCVGTILSHERLEDGRYNFLLQGHTRANVVREEMLGEGGGRYRVAELRPVAEKIVPEAELVEERGRLTALFEREAYVSGIAGGRQFKEMLAGGMPTAVVADLLAFGVLPVEEVGLKQSLLAEGDVRARVRRVAAAMEAVQPSWRNVPTNASMN
jgi:Lon protease-like protein